MTEAEGVSVAPRIEGYSAEIGLWSHKYQRSRKDNGYSRARRNKIVKLERRRSADILVGGSRASLRAVFHNNGQDAGGPQARMPAIRAPNLRLTSTA